MVNLSNHNELNNLMKKYLINGSSNVETENNENKNHSNLNTKSFNIDFNNLPEKL